jgi:hypothetical protein
MLETSLWFESTALFSMCAWLGQVAGAPLVWFQIYVEELGYAVWNWSLTKFMGGRYTLRSQEACVL